MGGQQGEAERLKDPRALKPSPRQAIDRVGCRVDPVEPRQAPNLCHLTPRLTGNYIATVDGTAPPDQTGQRRIVVHEVKPERTADDIGEIVQDRNT